MSPRQQQKRGTTMDYLEDHRTDRQDILGGWIVVLIANLAFVILAI